MLRMWTGKRVGGEMATTMRPPGQFFACSGSQPMLASNEAVDLDSSGLRPVCGLFASVAASAWQPVEAVSLSRPRTVRCRA